MEIDLELLSMKELRDLKKKVDRTIDGFNEKQRSKAMEAARSVAEKYGFKLTDLISEATPRKPIVPKYANPDDPSMTWSGRGLKPQWVKNQIASGKTLEELSI